MNVQKVLEECFRSEDETKRASEIIKQLDGLTISEAGYMLHVCEQALDQCEVRTISFRPEDCNGTEYEQNALAKGSL